MSMNKLIRITTVPRSLSKLLKGQMRFMSAYYEVIGVSSGGDTLREVSEYERVRVKPLEMTRKITPLKDLWSLVKMVNFLRKEKPLIVHTHTPKAGTVGMLAAKLTGVPIRLHTVAGLPLVEASGNKRKLLNGVEKLTYACATRVYPNSNGLKEIIIANKFCKESKLSVIANGSSNGIDTAYFSPDAITPEEKQKLREQLNIQPDDFVFIFIGRLVKDKGINELVAAFRRMCSEFRVPSSEFIAESSKLDDKVTEPITLLPDGDVGRGLNPKLLLVGPYEQDLDPLLQETIREIECNPNIISVGFQNDVRPYLAIANALVFPSYREGFPNVVMQAGAMELPSIVTDINGCNEIIVDGENGVIIPPKDEKALLGAMQIFLSDTEKVGKMTRNARAMIKSRYEQQVVWEALLEEYRKLTRRLTPNHP